MLEPRREPRPESQCRLAVHMARSEAEILDAQRLRYRVFAEEMGARLPSAAEGIDRDAFDPWCEHLLVTEEDTGEVVGTYRILTGETASASADFIRNRSSTYRASLTCATGPSRSAARACIRTIAAGAP